MIITNDDSKLHLQKEGTPQGCCTSSVLADLYLLHYEFKFKNNNVLRLKYIDDTVLISSNDVLTFGLPVKYPSNLMLTYLRTTACIFLT